MTLTQAYLYTGALLFFPGVALLVFAERARAPFLAALRSLPAAILTFGGAAFWFLYHILSLTESDLAGFPRPLLLGIFGGTALLAFYYLRDQLAARGLAILLLLYARVLLNAGYMQQPQNFLLSATAYLFVILGIYWGFVPYRLRDWSEFLLATPRRARVTAAAFSLLACALFACAVWVGVTAARAAALPTPA